MHGLNGRRIHVLHAGAAGAFLIWLVGTVLGSFVAFGLTDSAAIQGKYSVQFYQNSTSCSFDTFKATPLGSSSSAISTFGSSFAVSMGIWLPVSLVRSILRQVQQSASCLPLAQPRKQLIAPAPA